MSKFNTLSKLVSANEKSEVVHIITKVHNDEGNADTRCAFHACSTDVFYDKLPKGKRFCMHCAKIMTVGQLKQLK